MKKNKTTYEYPIAYLCGKISRHSRVIHACTASGGQITYLQGKRDLNAHPVTAAELARQNLFKRRQAVVSARRKKTAETYAADMEAYRNQMANGHKSFIAYLWAEAKKTITE